VTRKERGIGFRWQILRSQSATKYEEGVVVQKKNALNGLTLSETGGSGKKGRMGQERGGKTRLRSKGMF